MNEIGAYQAKTHFSEILDRVSKGEKIAITKHGVIVATLIPAGKSSLMNPKEVVSEIRSFRKGRRLGNLSIQRMKQEGRR